MKRLFLPFGYIGIKTSRSLIWLLFTVIFGLFGILFNVFASFPEKSLYEAILHELAVNSFYTYSVVLLASSMGALFVNMSELKSFVFSDIKIWLMVVIFILMFISSFLCQGMEKFRGHFWMQLGYFLISITLSIYSYCVCHLDEYPEKFARLLTRYSATELEEMNRVISKSQELTKDKNGNSL